MGDTQELLILLVAGGIGGFISGLLGVGGGIIFVPILDYFLIQKGVEGNDLVLYTLANSFLSILGSGLFGSYSAFRQKTIGIRQVLSVALSAIVTILITTELIHVGNWYTPMVFKLFFCALLLFTLVKTMLHLESEIIQPEMPVKVAVLIGIITGVVSGLSGLGGGVVMIPLFMMMGHMSIKKASILSLAVIPVIVFPNVILYLLKHPSYQLAGSTGYIAWSLAGPLLTGVLLTVNLGVRASRKLPPVVLKYTFAGFLILTIIKTLASVI